MLLVITGNSETLEFINHSNTNSLHKVLIVSDRSYNYEMKSKCLEFYSASTWQRSFVQNVITLQAIWTSTYHIMYSCGKRLVWSPNNTVVVDAKCRMKLLCMPWKDSQPCLIVFHGLYRLKMICPLKFTIFSSTKPLHSVTPW